MHSKVPIDIKASLEDLITLVGTILKILIDISPYIQIIQTRMLHITRTAASNPDFIGLVRQLDIELAVRDGDDHSFYAQFNTLNPLKHVIVAYADGIPVACGALKPYDVDTLEVKRMYTLESQRSLGIASRVLEALEQWAAELGYKRCILETGLNQPEAIRLYHKNHYNRIPNYGQYEGVANSVCFEKILVR